MKVLILIFVVSFSFLASASEIVCSERPPSRDAYKVLISQRPQNTEATLSMNGKEPTPLQCGAGSSSQVVLGCYVDSPAGGYQFYLSPGGESGALWKANVDGTTTYLADLSCK